MSAGPYAGDVVALILTTLAAIALAIGFTILVGLLFGPPIPLAVLP